MTEIEEDMMNNLYTNNDQFQFENDISLKLFEEIPEKLQEQYEEPYLEIINQPKEKFRFRYKTEVTQKNHRRLGGSDSKNDSKKSLPTVKLHNYNGESVIFRILLCRNGENLHKIHYNNLIMKNSSKDYESDPIYLEVGEEKDFTLTIEGAIMITKRNDIHDSLMSKIKKMEDREKCQQKFEDEIRTTSYLEKDKVTIRIDVFKVNEFGKYVKICKEVFMNTIADTKSPFAGELKINRLNKVSSSCKGGEEIWLLVEKVSKDIKVKFFDEDINWERCVKPNPTDIHHQVAIVIKTPPYKNVNLDCNKEVKICLIRDQNTLEETSSEPRKFTYVPSKTKRIIQDDENY